MSATPEEQADAIAESAASGIASVTNDGHTTEEHPLPDRIEAAKFAAAQAARRRGGPTVRLVRVLPPGAV